MLLASFQRKAGVLIKYRVATRRTRINRSVFSPLLLTVTLQLTFLALFRILFWGFAGKFKWNLFKTDKTPNLLRYLSPFKDMQCNAIWSNRFKRNDDWNYLLQNVSAPLVYRTQYVVDRVFCCIQSRYGVMRVLTDGLLVAHPKP